MSSSIPPNPNPTERVGRGGSVRVLHVDDDDGFSALTAEFLSRAEGSFDVSSVTDAVAGIERLETEPFDCVVSDYEMPGMDGLTFLRAVRERWPDLPFVLFTGKGTEAIASEAIAAGVSDYLPKDDLAQFDRLASRLSALAEGFRTERELAQVRRRYELLSSVVADAFFEWEVETDRIWRRDGYGRVFGYDPDTAVVDFDRWTDRIHPVDRNGVLDRLTEALESGSNRYEDTFRYRLGDGSFELVSACADVSYDDGSPLRVTGVLTDLSDLVIRDRELERTYARLELAVKGTETGIWEWNIETDEVVWDETTRQLFGVTDTDFDGTRASYTSFIHPDDLSQVERSIEAALETDGCGEFEVEHRLRPNAQGLVRWVHGKGTVIYRQSEPVSIIGVVTDVTASRERRAELERQTERLAEFASVVSHDLRAPLSVASGYLALVEPDDDADGQRLAAVERAHDRIRGLVSDLLTLAKQGESVDHLSAVSLARAAEASWDMVDTDDATLAVDADVSILADDGRLAQVFENLYRNAVEHGRSDDGTAPPLGVCVGLIPRVGRAVTTGDDGGELPPARTTAYRGFYVADDGVGIARETLERVFEAGYTTADTGTGFGLAIVHRIARAHGWTVRAVENDGGGVRFEFTGVDFVNPDRPDRTSGGTVSSP